MKTDNKQIKLFFQEEIFFRNKSLKVKEEKIKQMHQQEDIFLTSPAPCWTNEEYTALFRIDLSKQLADDIKYIESKGWENWTKKAKGII
jgi:hypothetical protein